MPEGREYELKFEIQPPVADRLVVGGALIGAGERHTARLVSTYFDTPSWALRRRRVSLRVRRSDTGTVHTLKRAAGSIVDREEWERSCDAARPDTAWLLETPLGKLFENGCRAAALLPLFTVETTRTTFPISYKGATIEAALDSGVIRTERAAPLPISEFELERKDGSPKAVLALARRLAADHPLLLSLASKSERGYGAIDGSVGRPTKALPLALDRDMTLAQLFEAIVQACLHTLLHNAALIVGDQSIEGTHRARIALRHLRAALDLFKPILRRDRLEGVGRDVKWMSDMMGAARDADVFQVHCDGIADDDAVPGVTSLVGVLKDLQSAARARLVEALATSRWRLLLLDLLAFSNNGVRAKRRNDGFETFVRRRLARRRRTLAKRARGLGAMSAEDLHDVRKKAKMLRYDCDFFEAMPKLAGGRRASRRLSDSLQTLQETLGTLHDDHAMRTHLQDMALSEGAARARLAVSPEAAFAAGFIAARPTKGGKRMRRAKKAARRL